MDSRFGEYEVVIMTASAEVITSLNDFVAADAKTFVPRIRIGAIRTLVTNCSHHNMVKFVVISTEGICKVAKVSLVGESSLIIYCRTSGLSPKQAR